MYSLNNKRLGTLCASLVLGAVALIPGSSGALVQNQDGLKQVAVTLEKTLPAFVYSEDYRSASNTAFLLATARSRLDQTVAACAALAQSLEYYRKAIVKETGLIEAPVSSIDDHSDGMADVRARFGCTQGHAA